MLRNNKEKHANKNTTVEVDNDEKHRPTKTIPICIKQMTVIRGQGHK